MDLSAGSLVASMVVSSVGFVLFVYGKKEVRLPQLVVGLVMMIFPCFGTGALVTWSLGGTLGLGLFAAVRRGL